MVLPEFLSGKFGIKFPSRLRKNSFGTLSDHWDCLLPVIQYVDTTANEKSFFSAAC